MEVVMILVRDVFQIKFGRMKEALEAWKEMERISPMPAESRYRMLTDLTGQYYTLVLEGTFKDLTDYEKSLRREMAGAGDVYHKKFVPLVDSGRREIFTVVA
jgi:hypothetical protein